MIGRRNFRAMPPIRRLSNEVGRMAFSWAVGREIADNQSGYRLVSRRLAEATIDSDEHGFAFEVEQITTCIRMGGTIAWVPIRTIYAGAPSHIRPIAHLREFVRIVRKARRDVREPLDAATVSAAGEAASTTSIDDPGRVAAHDVDDDQDQGGGS